MNFKLIENFDDNTREYVQEYLYDAITELGSASLSDYIQWFKDNTDDYDSEIEQALTDAYIEAVDYGTITDVNKTMITSELWSYIDAHEDLLEHDHVALLQQCPQHLQHELKLVLNKLDESLTAELLTESINTNLRKFLISLLELSNVDWKSLLNVDSVDDIVVHHIGKDRTANSVNDLALMSDHWHRSMHTKYSGDRWDPSVLKNYPHILISDLLGHVADNLISQNKQDELAIKDN